jgi:uncharacterized metal-binding protein YceD (DUF177 family)
MSKSHRPESTERPPRGAPRSFPWSVPVALGDVPEAGRHVEMIADANVRAATARLAGVTALPELSASFDVSLRGRGGLHVAGRVAATVEQVCVVTLEPVENHVEEPIDLIFLPEHAVQARRGGRDGDEIELTAEDEPEALEGGVVDLGAIATEFLLLGIDPYPRKPGAVFETPGSGPDDEAGPFAALAALKKGAG